MLCRFIKHEYMSYSNRRAKILNSIKSMTYCVPLLLFEYKLHIELQNKNVGKFVYQNDMSLKLNLKNRINLKVYYAIS